MKKKEKTENAALSSSSTGKKNTGDSETAPDLFGNEPTTAKKHALLNGYVQWTIAERARLKEREGLTKGARERDPSKITRRLP